MADLVNVCRFVAGSSGTADFADGTAEAGFLNLDDAGAQDGVTYPYRAETADRSEWEIGRGAYASSDGLLARTTISKSSNADAKVNFSTPPTVLITPLSDDLAVRSRSQEWTAQQNVDEQSITSTSNAVAWNVDTAQCALHALTEDTTITPSGMRAGGTYVLRVVQDSTPRTVSWAAVVKWPGGIPPVMSTGSGDMDVFTFYSDGTNLLGSYQQAFA